MLNGVCEEGKFSLKIFFLYIYGKRGKNCMQC